METLKNRLQASVLFSVSKCNPNGDPLNANRPRTDYDGYGFMTRECIQRKIRNRLQQMGYDIFIQSENSVTDGNKTLKERFAAAGVASKTREETAAKACEKWFDVRSFGQIFAFKADKEDAGGDSIGIRGPVSTQDAYSIDPVEVESIQITKSCSSELKEGETRSSDTMGMRHVVKFGLYRLNITMNPQLAEKTGFSDKDAEIIIEALKTLFDNDESSARPAGSMNLEKVVVWNHNCKNGKYTPKKVFDTLKVTLKDPQKTSGPVSVEDYDITLAQLEGVTATEY